jgi:hypothetical protein
LAEPTFEQVTAIVNQLAEDRQGASRLRRCLGIAFQLGELGPGKSGTLDCLVNLANSFLRRVAFANLPGLSCAKRTELIAAFDQVWNLRCHPTTESGKKSKKPSSKQLEADRELLLLDAMVCLARGRLTEREFLATVAIFIEPENTKSNLHGSKPWDWAAVLANDGAPPSTGLITRQAQGIHELLSAIERKWEKERGDGEQLRQKVAQLEAELEKISDELERTSSELDAARTKIKDLRNDVTTAGNIGRHRLDDMKARMCGYLTGELDRHLKTIQACVEMDPPRARVAVERVETLIKSNNRELEWLQYTE